jgi:A/G-specific adenine glycosylase
MAATPGFSTRLLDWWEVDGRHDLPWQLDRSPYRVWLSEIMLQQTQVATVIPYFERFIARFPTLEPLAEAALDEVLSLWSGLGYYARARNLHAAARICLEHYQGRLPDQPELLHALPGIGLSTANAILAQAWDRRAPILDANVKRVLARHAEIEGWPGRSIVEKALWAQSERYTPEDRAADFTQAFMDLGATVCTPRAPACTACPVAQDCKAFLKDRVGELPSRKPRKAKPRRQADYLILRDTRERILLFQRPPSGIWGGLWCFPEASADLEAGSIGEESRLAPIVHEFSHFTLTMNLKHLSTGPAAAAEDGSDRRWFSLTDALDLGLPKPVRGLIEQLQQALDEDGSR